MSINHLPQEILLDIFSRLPGSSVIKCREVCRRWHDIVDSIPDYVWRVICKNNCSSWLEMEYKMLRKKNGLTWYETFKSINTWSTSNKVKNAKIDVKEIGDHINFVKVLPHSILACLQARKSQKRIYYDYSDTIVYYDLKTSQEIHRREFDFLFLSRQYDENQYFLVLVKDGGTLLLVMKETNEIFKVGNLKSQGGFYYLFFRSHYYSEYTLLNKEVFFKDCKDEVLYVSKWINEDGKPTVSTEPLDAFNTINKDVVEFCYLNGCLFMLTMDGCIYRQVGVIFHKLSKITWDKYHNNQFEILDQHGFEWRSRTIYLWLLLHSYRPITFNPFIHAFSGHVHLILGEGASTCEVCLFWSRCALQETTDLFDMFMGEPTKAIDLSVFTRKPIQQVDFVDDGNTRKIIVLGGKRLFLVEMKPTSFIIHRSPTKDRIIKKDPQEYRFVKSPYLQGVLHMVKLERPRQHPYYTRSKNQLPEL